MVTPVRAGASSSDAHTEEVEASAEAACPDIREASRFTLRGPLEHNLLQLYSNVFLWHGPTSERFGHWPSLIIRHVMCHAHRLVGFCCCLRA